MSHLKESFISVCKAQDSHRKSTYQERKVAAMESLVGIASRFSTTIDGAYVLSVLFELQFKRGNGTGAEDIMRHCNMTTWDWIELYADLELLIKQGLVLRKHSFRSINYSISQGCVKAILNDSIFVQPNYEGLTNRKYFRVLEKHLRSFLDDQLPLPDLMWRLNELHTCNPDLVLPRLFAEQALTPVEQLLIQVVAFKSLINEEFDLIWFAKEFEQDDYSLEELDLNFDLGDMDEFYDRVKVIKQDDVLFRNWLKQKQTNYFNGSIILELKPEIHSALFYDVDILVGQSHSKFFTVRQPEEIENVELFYDTETAKELEEIELALMDYGQVFERQHAHQVKPYLSICLHGNPGTGKSQWLKSLSKKTGRPLYVLNLESIRDSYFSESEKKTKQLFTDMKKHVRELVARKEFNKLPLFAWEEVDGFLFANRKIMSGRNSTDNTIGNITSIVLTEMENLEPGTLLFVTTNIAHSNDGISRYDEALHRRFTHRLNINVPQDPGTRYLIFKSIFGERLSEGIMREFAVKYTLTGANIANVYRRWINRMIMKGVSPNQQELEQWLVAEVAGWVSSNPIGFRAA